jgi:hypothetical protein
MNRAGAEGPATSRRWGLSFGEAGGGHAEVVAAAW